MDRKKKERIKLSTQELVTIIDDLEAEPYRLPSMNSLLKGDDQQNWVDN